MFAMNNLIEGDMKQVPVWKSVGKLIQDFYKIKSLYVLKIMLNAIVDTMNIVPLSSTVTLYT